jgi:glucan-binding YG repeat protein
MTQKEIMEQIAPNLEPQAAHVVTVHTLQKDTDGDKMFARLNGGRKKSDPENPWWGEVQLKKVFGGLLLGTSYKSHVAGAAVRSGATETKSSVEVKTKQSWHTFENRFFEKDKATGEKFYLKIQSSQSTLDSSVFVSITETYIIKGIEYSRKQAEEILKGYLKPIKPTKPTSTQVEAGVTKDNEIKYYLPNVEDIVEIRQGDYIYIKK